MDQEASAGEGDRGLLDGDRARPEESVPLPPPGLPAWSRQGEHAKAIADFDEAIRLAPKEADAYISRGIEWEKDLEPDKALADYQKAISLDPRRAIAYDGRGRIWKERKEYAKAAANFAQLALMLPDDPRGHRELAWLLATCEDRAIRDGKRAVDEATTACKLTNGADIDCIDTLAAAYAETGDFANAIKWQTRAIEFHLLKNSGVDELINMRKEMDMRERLALYNRRTPYRENPNPAGR